MQGIKYWSSPGMLRELWLWIALENASLLSFMVLCSFSSHHNKWQTLLSPYLISRMNESQSPSMRRCSNTILPSMRWCSTTLLPRTRMAWLAMNLLLVLSQSLLWAPYYMIGSLQLLYLSVTGSASRNCMLRNGCCGFPFHHGGSSPRLSRSLYTSLWAI